jgi:hypothetical protein
LQTRFANSVYELNDSNSAENRCQNQDLILGSRLLKALAFRGKLLKIDLENRLDAKVLQDANCALAAS